MASSDVGDAGVCAIGGNEAFTPRRMIWKPSSLIDRLCPPSLAERGIVTLVHHNLKLHNLPTFLRLARPAARLERRALHSRSWNGFDSDCHSALPARHIGHKNSCAVL
jgi:hypothetical protein